MTFQILPLEREVFTDYFDKSEAELATMKACRVEVTSNPGFPCRISLRDAEIGESVILLNYEHIKGLSPYASTHAIFIRENSDVARPEPGNIPEFFKGRTLSVRGLTKESFIKSFRVVDGISLADTLCELLSDPGILEVHIHHAGPGCYAAKAIRV